MSRETTPSFVTELPLSISSREEKILLVRLDAARQVYNACLGESLKRFKLLRESKQCQRARRMKKGCARAISFRLARQQHGFSEYDLHAYAKQFGHSWLGEHLDSHVIQKIATRAFKAVEQHAYGKRGKPRFKGKNQFDSVEGKSNKTGIRWREDHVAWLELELQAIIDQDDPIIMHGLQSRVKYVRIVRRKIKGRNRFYVQLICEGQAYQKPENKHGSGPVGLDIGPSTIAVVCETEVRLMAFANEVKDYQPEIRRLQRRLDRQRRANNPDNYNDDGTVKKGARRWKKSNRQVKTQTKIAEIKRKQAAARSSAHGCLVNEILSLGDQIKLEALSYRIFQCQYGKSVGRRAPGMFVEKLKRKAESAGALVHEFPTHETRFSQLCHGCSTYRKKSLGQRWHRCGCGIVAQRDVYSAFLSMCLDVSTNKLNAGYAREAWPSVEARMRAALGSIQTANGKVLPSSFGLRQRQSGSPVKSMDVLNEARDVVPQQTLSGGLGRVWDIDRTP
jgi:putative transposase